MIKKVSFVWITLMLSMGLQLSFANSGPAFWQGHPSSEVLTIDKNCPIAIEEEKLVFDLSSGSTNSYTINGLVTASYKMVNPTDNDVSVQMAFPFISTLNDFSQDDVIIEADGTILPYALYIGDVVNSYGNPLHQEKDVSLAFSDIVNKITSYSYQSKHFSEYEKGILYTLKVEPTTEQRINLAVNFSFDNTKTKVLTNGFNGFERSNEKIRITAWCYKPEVLEILVLGDALDFSVSGYTDGELKNETSLFTCQITQTEKELKSYLMENVKEYEEDLKKQLENVDMQISDFDEVQLYNLYAKALDSMFTNNGGFSTCYDLMVQNHYQRIITLVYSVDFPANSRRDICVSYQASGTMDKTKTVKPVHSFNYLLNPAKNWSSFHNLTIEVITPEEAPYIIDSSIELFKERDRYYKASLSTLPEKDLVFSLYSDERVSYTDKAYGSLSNTFGYLTPFVIGGLLILMAVIACVVSIKWIKKKQVK